MTEDTNYDPLDGVTEDFPETLLGVLRRDQHPLETMKELSELAAQTADEHYKACADYLALLVAARVLAAMARAQSKELA